MENQLSSNLKADNALNSLKDIAPATPTHYFYSKLVAKMNHLNTSLWEKWSAFFLRPTVAFSAILFIIVINAFVLYSKIEPDTYPADQTGVASLDEYNLATTAFYDLENEKP